MVAKKLVVTFDLLFIACCGLPITIAVFTISDCFQLLAITALAHEKQ